MTWSLLLSAHVVAALAALPVGAVNILRRPRGDRFHRTIGHTWVAFMYWVAASSFWIRELRPGAFSAIHLLSLLTLVTLTLGFVHGIRRNVHVHRGMMIGTYLGLVGAFIGAVAVPERDLPQLILREAQVASVAALAIALGTTVLLLGLRWGFRRNPPPSPGPG